MEKNKNEGNQKAEKAKQQTIEELQKFEQSKAQADASLREKLKTFSSDLSTDEKDMLDKLLNQEDPITVSTEDGADVSVFLKPQQKHSGEEFTVFLKPQQSHGGGKDVEVFLKPQQSHGGVKSADEVFLKPQQSHRPSSEE